MTRKRKQGSESTEGQRILHAIMTGGRSQKQIGRDLLTQGVPASAGGVSLWVRGKMRPEGFMREALFRLYGIPPLSWLTEDEKVIIAALTRVDLVGDASVPFILPSRTWTDVTTIEEDLTDLLDGR